MYDISVWSEQLKTGRFEAINISRYLNVQSLHSSNPVNEFDDKASTFRCNFQRSLGINPDRLFFRHS